MAVPWSVRSFGGTSPISHVTGANAGIQGGIDKPWSLAAAWTPASAGMTSNGDSVMKPACSKHVIAVVAAERKRAAFSKPLDFSPAIV